MDPEMIIPSEVSLTEKDKYRMILFTCGILKKKKDTNELIYKTERPTHIENKLKVIKGNR